MTIVPAVRDGWLVQSDIVSEPAQAAVEGVRFGQWMQTFTGRQFWPMDPRASEVNIFDIAHSLSMQCRYAGHCLRFYSVAEHSVHVARWLLDSECHEVIVLKGLMHDAPEAYLVDVPRPVKPFLPGYKQAEAAVWLAVSQKLGHGSEVPIEVHEADNRILNDERAQNMAPCDEAWGYTGEPLGIKLQFWSPEEAEDQFVKMYDQITRKM